MLCYGFRGSPHRISTQRSGVGSSNTRFQQSIIRLAVPEDAQLLPAIETSAAQAFRMMDALSWLLAESAPMSIEGPNQLIGLSTGWVGLDD